MSKISTRITYLVSTPIIFVLLLNQSGMSTSSVNAIHLSTDHTRFAEVGDTLDFSVDAQSLLPVNAIGIALSYPKNLLSITEVSKGSSIIDLWVEEPSFHNDHGQAKFSGGITVPGGFVGSGHIATVTFTALYSGKAPITISDAVLLARDGAGTNVLEVKGNLTFIIRGKGAPSPDVNGDGELTITDAALTYFATLRSYDSQYDFNNDGKISFADVKNIGSLLHE